MTKTKNPRTIIKRQYLVSRRAELGISQYRVCQLTKFDIPTYSQIENGKSGLRMNAYILIKLADALEMPVEELVQLEADYFSMFCKINDMIPQYMVEE